MRASPLNPRQASGFFRELSALLDAGLPLDRALAVLAETASERLSNAIQVVVQHVTRGGSLAHAGSRAGLFAATDSRLIRAAERSGTLQGLLHRLADGYERRARRGARIKARLAMPLAVLVLALAVGPLPALVGGRIGVSTYLTTLIWQIVLLAGALTAARSALTSLLAGGAGGTLGATVNIIPVLGPIQRALDSLRFLETLGASLAAGLPILDALPPSIAAVRNAHLRRGYNAALSRVRAGQPLADALVGNDLSAHTVSLIRAGEAAGRLDQSIQKVIDIDAAEVDLRIDHLAQWVPRLVYAAVSVYLISGLF